MGGDSTGQHLGGSVGLGAPKRESVLHSGSRGGCLEAEVRRAPLSQSGGGSPGRGNLAPYLQLHLRGGAAEFNQDQKLPGATEAGSPVGLPRIPGEPLLQAVCVEGGSGPRHLGFWTGRTSAHITGTSRGKKGLSFQLDLEQARENL